MLRCARAVNDISPRLFVGDDDLVVVVVVVVVMMVMMINNGDGEIAGLGG